MDNKQRTKLDAYNRVIDFCIRNQAVLSAIPDFTGEQAKFDAKVKAIKASGGIQEQPVANDGDTVEGVKAAMGRILMKFTGRAAVKARIAGNSVLVNQLDYTISDIVQAPKATALQVANNIRKVLNDNLSVFTNIVAADIAEIDKAITAYDKVKDAPTEAIHSKKATGTDLLPTHIEGADNALENMYDLVVSYLSDTRPELVNEMALAKQLIVTGTRKAKDDNKPVVG